jgi:hypothetical protein
VPSPVKVQRVIDLGPCDKCGQVHDRCKGHRRGVTPPEPCRKPAIRGALHCDRHGATKAARNKAARTLADEKKGRQAGHLMRRQLDEAHEGPVRDPARQLERLAGDQRALYKVTRSLVADLIEADDLIEHGEAGAGVARPDVKPVIKWNDRVFGEYWRLLVQMHRVGIAERHQAIEDEMMALVADAVRMALIEARVDTDAVLPILAGKLRALETSGVEVDP